MSEQNRPTLPDAQESKPSATPRAVMNQARERLATGVAALRRFRTDEADDRYAGKPGADPSVVCPDVPRGCTPEEFVIELLEANGGRLSWRPLREELGWSNKAARGILHGMVADEKIVVDSAPNKRKVAYLPESAPPDAGAGDTE